jgi:hypothetical protein
MQRLRERMSLGTPNVHNDLSLIFLVPKWSELDSAVTLEEFFASMEASAKIGRWEESDKREIAVLRLTGSAKLFYQGCTELHEEGVTWQFFKNAFRHRYKDKHTDQYHFKELQTIGQAKKENPQDFVDPCRALAQKVMGKSDGPPIQRVHRENAKRMLLASFVSGLSGVSGRNVRFANPWDMDQALKIALTVQEGERQESFNESFYTQFDKSVRLCLRSPGRSRSESESQRKTADSRTVNRPPAQRYNTPRNAGRSETPSARNTQTQNTLRCYDLWLLVSRHRAFRVRVPNET